MLENPRASRRNVLGKGNLALSLTGHGERVLRGASKGKKVLNRELNFDFSSAGTLPLLSTGTLVLLDRRENGTGDLAMTLKFDLEVVTEGRGASPTIMNFKAKRLGIRLPLGSLSGLNLWKV